MASELRISETIHPHKEKYAAFDSLIAIEEIKEALVDELALILDRKRLDKWQKQHHPHGLPLADRAKSTSPLIILAGDVGCGKTALASCVASPVAKAIDQRIACFETPSDVRGSGLVGELSTRLTEAFSQARMKAARTGRGILIIDEADDLATRRGQMQAHHEDRAGVNVLIKQLDQIALDPTPMAVIMITNRADVLDPAVLRRAVLILEFKRPDDTARAALFKHMLEGTGTSASDIAHLVKLTKTMPAYTFSDLTVRLARVALRRAMNANEPFGVDTIEEALKEVKPSPPMEAGRA
jgi:SpoVK/Ycf46/Vps4 family AAA+-type ATPase